jgi:hypothetical protein
MVQHQISTVDRTDDGTHDAREASVIACARRDRVRPTASGSVGVEVARAVEGEGVPDHEDTSGTRTVGTPRQSLGSTMTVPP